MQRDIIKKWALILFLSFFVIYGLYESYKILLGPRIYVDMPRDGQSFKKSLVDVKGSAKNVAFIKMNGRAIFLDKEGRFDEKLILVPGYNIMTLQAEDRFKKNVEKRMYFYLEGNIPEVKQIETATSTNKIIEAEDTATSTTTDINN